ncbi:mediator of RNA polymerase II transcription subunit 6-like [Protopterus annectens]|uniref:mediator of RNA polymerase II transcription subunit 6-like n=1 Tax=Protopterus annectens TaxID=7888 RepID=UPI001CFB56FC|nr:mediator of RNA polymerase II transcription subunit 6-like [Protopterus annectens]
MNGNLKNTMSHIEIQLSRGPSDNLLGISWIDSAWSPILNSANVLDYFSERSNPFYDRTCNNEVVKMQRLTLDHLNQMVGVEYILLHTQDPILYIIRKQQRQSPTQVVPLADYYIIAGVVYQAPDLGSVINSRVVSLIHYLPVCCLASCAKPRVVCLVYS